MPTPNAVLPVLLDLARRRAALDPARVEPGSRLVDLGLDSVVAMELVVDVERAFDLSIPGEDLQGLETVGEVVRYVEGRLARR